MTRERIVIAEPRVEEQPWGNEIFMIETDQYIGKLLQMRAGLTDRLTVHTEKMKTLYLAEGIVLLDYEDGEGSLRRHVMRSGECIHVPVNATLRLEAITDCLLVEWSTPHYDDEIYVEEEYGEEEPVEVEEDEMAVAGQE